MRGQECDQIGACRLRADTLDSAPGIAFGIGLETGHERYVA